MDPLPHKPTLTLFPPSLESPLLSDCFFLHSQVKIVLISQRINNQCVFVFLNKDQQPSSRRRKRKEGKLSVKKWKRKFVGSDNFLDWLLNSTSPVKHG
ncbi:hypothetical protein CMV_016347 [Castanea mollissima]|uniref:Uncharacterized protein n=1 Tax=Castanea mollissima TaxID=60419 RepID=A0A8J4QZU8_9ROSI|nr:hypothetical protein CMV_016347 [Castanea mollissima]